MNPVNLINVMAVEITESRPRQKKLNACPKIVVRRSKLIASTIFMLVCTAVYAQSYSEVTTLIAQSFEKDGTLEEFGYSVDIDSNYAVVGAPFYRDTAECALYGAAFILEKDHGGIDHWGIVKVLVNPDSVYDKEFGSSVAVSGNRIVVGAPEFPNAAYVFEKGFGGVNNWGMIKKLSPIAATTEFGSTVSIDDTVIVVGAPNSNVNGFSDAGVAHVYSQNYGGASNWGEVKVLVASDTFSSDNFGYDVDISANTVVIGAIGNDDAGNNSGSAYVFEKDNGGINYWAEVVKLTASDAGTNDNFGISVSIDEDFAIIGAYRESGKGACYLYGRDNGGSENWGEVKKITASDGSSGDGFGWDVSVGADIAAIGARTDDDYGSQSGSCYIISRDEGGVNNWGEVKKIMASNASAADQFGNAVGLSEGNIICAAALTDSNGYDSGSIYVFSENFGGSNQWNQISLIISRDVFPAGIYCDGETIDFFGYSVDIFEDFVVIGSYSEDSDGLGAGAAYIFQKNTDNQSQWTFIKKLTSSTPGTNAHFGASVAIYDTIITIGANGDNENGINSGALFIYSLNEGGTGNWGEVTKLTASDGANGDQFGYAIDIYDGVICVGAPYDDDSFSNSGSVYIFSKDLGGQNNWGQLLKLNASDIEANDQFGRAVSLHGDAVMVGAPFNDDSLSNSGSAYIFSKDQGGIDNWGEIKKLTPGDSDMSDEFGTSVCISDSFALVGAPFNDDSFNNSGSAYLFGRNFEGSNNWGELTKLNASNPAANDQFGSSVSITYRIALVGAPEKNTSVQAPDAGIVYAYSPSAESGTWIEHEIIESPSLSPSNNDEFGFSLAAHENTFVSGARQSITGNFSFGWVSVHERHWPTDIVYVDSAANGAVDGTTWQDAFTDLQDALGASRFYPNVSQIWTARGTYPTTNGTDRSKSFILVDSVTLYGGFNNQDSMISERDILTNRTVLSGDLGVTSDASDNAYHVVEIDSNCTSCVLDGFTIQHGNADMLLGDNALGGGVHSDGIGVIRNSSIRDCLSTLDGSAVFHSGTGALTLQDCTFEKHLSSITALLSNEESGNIVIKKLIHVK